MGRTLSQAVEFVPPVCHVDRDPRESGEAFGFLFLASLLIAFPGRCAEAFRSLPPPIHCHPSCPALPTEKSEAVTVVGGAGPINVPRNNIRF